MQAIQLGNEVQDTVTGFRGIAIAKVEYLTGCAQFGVKPPIGDDGKMTDSVYLDEHQLIVVGSGVGTLQVEPRLVGGPRMDAPRQ